ncbi:YiiX/YebB-like N1pC/P60 family cysteine hydrolase [Amphritea balenae]|uniref:Lipo-like protein n=1 Tax=Amphritea balenae TaxID=452629 RepID=A0A3P1SKX9_9GAMM|nr:YiiX/YebB-like N1pC/P60 family cysteine hydrolase [Amphritea balenae]RRC97931.1 lipo-like protein [Amphritea balenae]GGK81865.1 hypothetical protein GCM10007941_35360 [Amphritea balenae]
MLQLLETLGSRLARYLSDPRNEPQHVATSSPEKLASCIRKGDVLLVEGTSRISTTIKYLTQSTWSHAAICIGHALDSPDTGGSARTLMEADVNDGVRAVPLSHYYDQHTRLCRPIGLTETEIDRMIQFLIARLGDQYDHKNVFDLARYLFPTPPVPVSWRQKMLQLGSGDPTRAICSSLIAEGFQSVHYPILPSVTQTEVNGVITARYYRQHHSFFSPRDFDVSPYFKVIKPMVEGGFDYQNILCWGDAEE